MLFYGANLVFSNQFVAIHILFVLSSKVKVTTSVELTSPGMSPCSMTRVHGSATAGFEADNGTELDE
jgi:hypothetical protein